MTHRYTNILALFIVPICVTACYMQFASDDPCYDVRCSGQGTCETTEEGRPYCRCYDNYEPRGRECVEIEEDADIPDVDTEVDVDIEEDREADTETDSDELIIDPPNLWPSPDIPVCWETRDKENKRNLVLYMLRGPRSWSNYTRIRFLDWGMCPENFPGIRIRITDRMLSDHGPNSEDFVQMELDFQSDRPEEHWTRCRNYEGNFLESNECIEVMALHEFGHALGLFHEQPMVGQPLFCGEEQVYGEYFFPDLIDEYSIMNHCNNAHSLSPGDIWNAMRSYGRLVDYPFGDYDGDGSADFTIIRREDDRMIWMVDHKKDGVADIEEHFGSSDDFPIPADYDGDGITEMAYISDYSGHLTSHIALFEEEAVKIISNWGATGDVPIPGDYDGDGNSGLVLVRNFHTTNNRHWYFDENFDGDTDDIEAIRWSWNMSLPVPGDYDGDYSTDMAVVRGENLEANWLWIFDVDKDEVSDHKENLFFGPVTGKAMVGQFDGDLPVELVVANREEGGFRWYIDLHQDGSTDLSLLWGDANGEPYLGDFDGDGQSDLVVITRVDGVLRWQISIDLGDTTHWNVDFGTADDFPL